MYIVTLAEAKDVIGIADAIDDVALSLMMEGLEGRFDSSCQRRFLYKEDVSEILDGGYSSIFLERFPIASVSQIVVDGDQEWGEAASVLDSDDYLVINKRGSLIYGRGNTQWPAGKQCIQVTYSGGFFKSDTTAADYVDDAERAAVRRAFFMQISFDWRNRKTVGMSQISAGGMVQQAQASVSLALQGQTLLPEVEQTLMPFKRKIM